MENIKQVTVTSVAQNVTFKKRTDFLIINRSNNDITFNLDGIAVIDDENCGMVQTGSVRQLGETGVNLSLIATVDSDIEIQAVKPSMVIIDNRFIASEV